MTAKILLIDIETAPTLAWVWEAYQTDIIKAEQDWYILCYAYQWYGQDKKICEALDKFDEKMLINRLWKLFDEADIVIAHNGDKFDIRKCNGMFLRYGLPPPSPYKSIDTLKIARKNFKLDRNNLNDLARYLKIGSKLSHVGFDLWLGCMKNDPAAWEKMKEYNIHDLELLHDVYTVLRPWHSGHPNLRLYSDDQVETCPTCHSNAIQRRGFAYTKVQVRQRFNCTSCGSWWSGKTVKR